jgi:ABC-type phosphate/phosphonate transport system substrate-binding protein
MSLIAALPMYDWPEVHHEVDAQWAEIRDLLRSAGLDAPDRLTRDRDLEAVWRKPNLILAQTCWGPLEQGLSGSVHVLGQPDYSAVEGGRGPLYSSALLMRKSEGHPVAAPLDMPASLPLKLLRGRRLAFNSHDSMSGLIGLTRDLEAAGDSIEIFGERVETGGHRASLRAVARGQADLCACDCRSWALMQRLEPEVADTLHAVGWTAKRKGLPFIMAAGLQRHAPVVRHALEQAGLLAAELTVGPRVA